MYAIDFDNPWVRLVAKDRARAWVVVLIAAVFAALVLIAFRFLGSTIASHIEAAVARAGEPWPVIAAQAALQGMVFGLLLLCAIIAGMIEKRPVWRAEKHSGLGILLGLLVGGLGFAACVGLASLAGAVVPNDAPRVHTALAAMVVGLLLTAFQSTVEEVFFRGWLQPLVCARWGPWLGLITVSVLFGALHVAGGSRGALALINLFLGGMLFGLLALRSGGLWTAAAAHFAWNWTESGVLGLDPNPGVVATGALIHLDLQGPSLWSGGADTLNGSLATTLVLMALVASLVVWKSSRSAQLAARRSDPVP